MLKERTWVRVSRRHPCVVCKHCDWCTRTADGEMALCMRVESGRPSKNSMGGWIHVLVEPLPTIVPRKREEPDARDWGKLATDLTLTPAWESNKRFVADKLGLTPHAMDALGVGYGYDHKRHECFTSWPECTHTGHVCGINRRFADGEKKMMKGGRHGLYFYRKQLESTNGPVLIVEGGSDTAALLPFVGVIGRPSAMGCVRECASLLKQIKRRAIVIAERDEKPEKRGTIQHCRADCKGCMHCYPGLTAAKAYAILLQKETGIPARAAFIGSAKDAREWIKARPLATTGRILKAIRYVS